MQKCAMITAAAYVKEALLEAQRPPFRGSKATSEGSKDGLFDPKKPSLLPKKTVIKCIKATCGSHA